MKDNKVITQTIITIQGEPQEVFEVYANETKEQTIGFVFDETTAKQLVSAPDLLKALQGMLNWARRVKEKNPGMEIFNAIQAIAKTK